jgi:hypothetical protein
MVEYASRMLSALEEYSIKGSNNGRVALQCLLLRRSFATSLWTRHDGVLNQLGGVGQKATALMKSSGISSFKDVLASTEERIESAAQRAPPFGSTLRAAVSAILSDSLRLSSSLENAHGSQTPCRLLCKIERGEACRTMGTTLSTAPSVSYTLLVYADQPGGCLLFKRDISSPKKFAVSTPATFSKITVALIASLVGLDGESPQSLSKIRLTTG